MADYYEILGVDRGCSNEQIKAAYREKALAYHPDHNPRAAAVFRSFNEAYKTLNSPETRAAYDRKLGIAPPIPPFAVSGIPNAVKQAQRSKA